MLALENKEEFVNEQATLKEICVLMAKYPFRSGLQKRSREALIFKYQKIRFWIGTF